MIKRLRYFLPLFLLMITPSLSAQGVRTWVSSSGLDTNPCSRSAPCRNFAAAMAAVDSGGEVVALDSAGYGPTTVNKAVSLIAPAGVHAAIAPTSGSAITITAGPSDNVVIRGLYLNSQGGSTGIHFTAGAALHVEETVISGFSSINLFFDVAAASELFVNDSVTRNGGDGITIRSSSGLARASVIRSRMENNSNSGIDAQDNAQVLAYESVAAGNASVGFRARPSTSVSQLDLDHCVAIGNGRGVRPGGFSVAGTIRMSNSIVTGNDTGLQIAAGGVLLSRLPASNTVEGNTSDGRTSDGAFGGTYSAK